jgi:phenylacetic acid degradation operon negative regulatory protein
MGHTSVETGTSLSSHALIDSMIKSIRLRAGAFIVTIYGDVVEPRGGHLWIGNLIETCASVGISESLVRTAVSRLVAADRLKGAREGRHSYYHLSEAAKTEFVGAAARIFGRHPEQDWCFIWLPDTGHDHALSHLELAGFRRLGANWFLGPRMDLPSNIKGLLFDAQTQAPRDMLQAMAATHWDLVSLAAAYQDFVNCFTPVLQRLDQSDDCSPCPMLQLRLLLVHQFRQVALRDPNLPDQALPDDWMGHRARALFAKLYCALSAGADAYIAHHFVSAQGPLPAKTVMIERRLELLEG